MVRVYSVYNDKPGVNLAIIVFTTEPIHEDFTQRPDSMMNPVFDSWRRVLSRWEGRGGDRGAGEKGKGRGVFISQTVGHLVVLLSDLNV